jgi:hypothetical protein
MSEKLGKMKCREEEVEGVEKPPKVNKQREVKNCVY